MVATNLSLANIPYWGCLPMMYTNYGGDVQISTVEPYQGYNIGLAFNPIAQQSWGIPGIGMGMGMPGISQSSVIADAQNLLGGALNRITSQNLNLCINNIGQAKSRLQAKMNAEGTTEDEKAKIQALLDKLKEKEDALRDIAQSTNLDPQTAYRKVSELEAEVNQIVREAISLINGTSTTSTTSTTGSTETTETTGSTSTTGSTETTETTGSTSTTGSTETTNTTEETQGTVDNFDASTRAAVDQFYDATYCWGTKNEEMEEVLGLVNKDNVMDLMLCWNKLHSAERGESLMEAFMWDADHSQKVTYGKLIARALRDKAEEIGVYDQCREDFAKIDKELGSWLWISNDISENFDNIIKKIADKMGSKYGSPQAQSDE